MIGFGAKFAVVADKQSSVFDKQMENNTQNILSDTEYKEYLQDKAAQQGFAVTAQSGKSGNSTVCISHSPSVGSWTLVLLIT